MEIKCNWSALHRKQALASKNMSLALDGHLIFAYLEFSCHSKQRYTFGTHCQIATTHIKYRWILIHWNAILYSLKLLLNKFALRRQIESTSFIQNDTSVS